jgi:hypothetical protein
MINLPDNFWSIPKIAHTTMTTRQLRDVLLESDGRILANGDFWEIVSKRIGPGVYRVSLKQVDFT